jgi:phage head maturation protease
MSFAFTVEDKGDTWTYGDKETVREVSKIKKLYDVSVVDTPFYDDTSIFARSLELMDINKEQLDSLEQRALLKQQIILKGKI